MAGKMWKLTESVRVKIGSSAIIVTRRADDILVEFEGDAKIWNCGETVERALYHLVRSNPAKVAESLLAELGVE